MTKDEFVAACLLLGRTVIYWPGGTPRSVHLRRWRGLIATDGESHGLPHINSTTEHWHLRDRIPYPYEVLLEHLITYLEKTHD